MPLEGTPIHRRVKDGSGSSGGGGERKQKKMVEAMTKSHFCHKCCHTVNPIKKFEIVCPICQSGFIEELEYIEEWEYTARDYDDNDNSYYHGKLAAICLDGQWMISLCWRYFPMEYEFLDLVLPGHQQGHGHGNLLTIHEFLDLVLPGHQQGHGHDSVCTAEHQESEQAEVLLHEELEDPVWSLTNHTSPPSPSNSDSSIPINSPRGDEEFKLIDSDSC